MARWGNALGGWRKQKRDGKGRFGSGSGKAYRKAARASKAQRKNDYQKASKGRLKSLRKAEARVDHQVRLAEIRKQHGVDRKKQAVKVAAAVGIVAGSAAAIHYAPKVKEHIDDRRFIKSGGVILYHNTPKNVGEDVISGKTKLIGSDYREHKSNQGVLDLFSRKNRVNAGIDLTPSHLAGVKAMTGRALASPSGPHFSSPGALVSHESSAANAKIASPLNPDSSDKNVYGNPVFFTNKHRGLARKQYGNPRWMKAKAKGGVSDQAMTLKLRYKGPLQTIEYDGWHWDNDNRGLIGTSPKNSVEVFRPPKRMVANTSGNLHATANPRGANRFAGTMMSRENYFMIPEHLVAKHGTFSKASVTGGSVPGKALQKIASVSSADQNMALGISLSTVGAYAYAGYYAGVKAPEKEVKRKRSQAKAAPKKAAPKKAAPKKAAPKKASKAGVVV